MAESNADDDIVEQVYHYLTKSEYPSGFSEYSKRGDTKESQKICCEGWKTLLHTKKQNTKLVL